MNEFHVCISDEIVEKLKEHFEVDNITNETITYILEEIVNTYYSE